jgi:hypothetical protein
VYEVHDQTNENVSKHFAAIVAYLKQAILMGENCLIYG